MTVRYSLNWMGPVNTTWYLERGLAKYVEKVAEFDSTLTTRKKGDIYKTIEYLEQYSTGRIDCRGKDLGKYGDELYVPLMHSEDWSSFGEWLSTVETDFMWQLEDLVEMYERKNPKIRWWKE